MFFDTFEKSSITFTVKINFIPKPPPIEEKKENETVVDEGEKADNSTETEEE